MNPGFRFALLVAALAAGSASAQQRVGMTLIDQKGVGASIGTIEIAAAPKGGGVIFTPMLKGLPPGEHAFHVHAVGKCEPPFTSAGPHFNPEQKKHGKLNKEGHHAGDMDNIRVPDSGNLTLQVVDKDITLEKGKPNSIFQDSGTALVVHAGKDDYMTDPAGNAGDRIACGVIR